MKNTRFTVESETHIATFEVVGYDCDSVDVVNRSTYTFPNETMDDFASGGERARQVTSAFGFGINAHPIARSRNDSVVALTAIIGNQTAVLMSLAKKETA
jgi:hypothetical protein